MCNFTHMGTERAEGKLRAKDNKIKERGKEIKEKAL